MPLFQLHPTQSGLTQTSLETGFLVGIKRLKSRVLIQKPGFCVSPTQSQTAAKSLNLQGDQYPREDPERSKINPTLGQSQKFEQKQHQYPN